MTKMTKMNYFTNLKYEIEHFVSLRTKLNIKNKFKRIKVEFSQFIIIILNA